jgi:hypothetical protein
MNAKLYIAAFAGISMTGLALQIVGDFWLPMLLGAGVTLLIARFVR